MGKTLTEKILERSCGHEVHPGEIIDAKIDRIMMMDWKVKAVFGYLENDLDCHTIANPDRFVMVSDHLSTGHTVKNAQLLDDFRKKAKEYGIKHFYGIGRTGICHQMMVQDGLVTPGRVCLGTDSHATSYGCLGAFSCGITTTEAAVILATEKLWLRVPETLKINLTGKLPFGCYGKDVALRILKELRQDEVALYKAIEITGEGVKSLCMDDRFAICNMMAETGAKNALIPCDEITREYLKGKVCEEYEDLRSDDDAVFSEVFNIDLNTLVPMIAVPPLVYDARPVSEFAGKKITRAFLGSCTSGRFKELELAANIFKDKKINEDVVMVVVPASNTIHAECAEHGLIQTFINAGCSFESSSCACCAGFHTGLLPDDAVCISTTNRNLVGRMGSKKSEVFLASAATVAVSALNGEITDPREILKKLEEDGK